MAVVLLAVEGGIERLADFARPFAEHLVRREQRDHARTYLAGLVSDLRRKNTKSIAYRGYRPDCCGNML